MLRVLHAGLLRGDSADAARVMEALFKVVRIGSLAALTEGEVAAVSFALSTVTAIVERSAGEWAKAAGKFPVQVLAKLLLDSPDARLRREAATTFCGLIGGGGYTLPGPDGALSPAAAATAALFLDPAPFLALPVVTATAGDFFGVCAQLLLVGGAWLHPPTLAALFAAKLAQVEAPVMEPADSVLVGTLTCLALLLELHPGCAADPVTLLDSLVDTYLMRLPWAASPDSVGHPKPLVDASGPLCNSPAARAAACRLLAALSAAPELKARVAQHLAHLATMVEAPAERHFTTDELKQTVRPGLVNTANRCYMNSLCQQLAGLDAFSAGVLAVAVPVSVLDADAADAAKVAAAAADKQQKPVAGTWTCPTCTCENDAGEGECGACGSPKPANVEIVAAGVDPEVARKEKAAAARAQMAVVREFQRTLRFLRCGEMAAYDAEPLLRCIDKNLGLQFPADQQNDSKEFMDKFLDRMEMELSETASRDLIKDTFGAVIATDKTRQMDGLHVSRSLEKTTTHTLSLQVEGVGSIDEAAAKYFEPAVREVDDDADTDASGKPVKYKFEYSQKYVELPRVLCVQQSRFGFDYARGVPNKQNHRVDFGTRLDLSKYSEAPHALYDLRGVLVHMGASANSGHYYSIVKSGDGFIKFNDSHVSPAESLEDECFGGEKKSWNAYLLFYERVDPDAPPDAAADAAAEAVAGSLREAAEREVQAANAAIWRRTLFNQRPVLELARGVLTADLPGLTAGLLVFERAVLHCADLLADKAALEAWTSALASILNSPELGFAATLCIVRGEAISGSHAEEAEAARLQAQASGQLMPIPMVSRFVLQVGRAVPNDAVRQAAAAVVAKALAVAHESLPGEASPVTWLLKKLLGSLADIYSEASLLDGFVSLLQEMALYPSLRALLRQWDVPALLVHVYCNSESPLSAWVDSEAISAHGGVAIPRLASNFKKANAAGYVYPLHDFRRLIGVLVAVLKEPFGLATLSQRALGPELLQRLVEGDPTAGIVPKPAALLTLAEENAMLAAEGWTYTAWVNGKGGTWERFVGGLRTYASARPVPAARKTEAELLDEALAECAAGQLLVVAIALLDPAFSAVVVNLLVTEVAASYHLSAAGKRRVRVLLKLVGCNDDGRSAERRALAVAGLRAKLDELRYVRSAAAKQLNGHTLTSRARSVVAALAPLQDEDDDDADDFGWVDGWVSAYCAPLRVTIDDLAGAWENNTGSLTVSGNLVVFAGGSTTQILTDPETGSLEVNGYKLQQEHSTPGNVNWRNDVNVQNRWTRPRTAVNNRDDDNDFYSNNSRTL
jgi:ubiquitin C-terminal hydrolase